MKKKWDWNKKKTKQTHCGTDEKRSQSSVSQLRGTIHAMRARQGLVWPEHPLHRQPSCWWITLGADMILLNKAACRQLTVISNRWVSSVRSINSLKCWWLMVKLISCPLTITILERLLALPVAWGEHICHCLAHYIDNTYSIASDFVNKDCNPRCARLGKTVGPR